MAAPALPLTEAEILLCFTAVENTSEQSRDLAQTPVPFLFSLDGMPSAGVRTAQNM
jgi:hypothetical protein